MKYDTSKCTSTVLQGYTGCLCDYCRSYKERRGRWIVNVKAMEVSVLRENNRHGIASYGWGDKDKIILANWDDPPMKAVKDAIVDAAKGIAERFNKAECKGIL